MKLIGVMPARNEGWAIRAALASSLRWCDRVIVLDHASTDDTAAIARTFDRVDVLAEADPVWREAAYRQRLLEAAREAGATHVATVDADELLTWNLIPHARAMVEALGDAEVLRLPWLMLWGSLDKVRANDDSVWSRATAPVAFKLGLETCYPQGDYDIHARAPAGLRPHEVDGRNAGLMHLQHVSRRRLAAKQALYKLNERIRWNTPTKQIERRYGPTADESGMVLADVPGDWWGGERAHVDADAEPWQEGEVKRLLSLHGREAFEGLDLLGVA